jgi:hypothetical protein
LRIRDVNSGYRIRTFVSRIQGQKDPGYGSASKNLSILTEKLFLSSRKYDPGCSSQIPDPGSGSGFFFSILDTGSRIQGSKRHKKAPDPGSESAALVTKHVTHPDFLMGS